VLLAVGPVLSRIPFETKSCHTVQCTYTVWSAQARGFAFAVATAWGFSPEPPVQVRGELSDQGCSLGAVVSRDLASGGRQAIEMNNVSSAQRN
jgi:hypothetical protein